MQSLLFGRQDSRAPPLDARSMRPLEDALVTPTSSAAPETPLKVRPPREGLPGPRAAERGGFSEFAVPIVKVDKDAVNAAIGVHEPPPPWYKDCNSDEVGMIVGAVIVFNAVIMGLETDLGAKQFKPFEWFFFFFFGSETVWRIQQLKWEYPKSGWNLFDFFLVNVMVFDMVLIPMLASSEGGSKSKGHGSIGSMLRLLRMARIMRVIRLFRMFSMLAVIMQAFAKAVSVVMWVGLLILIVDYIFAIVCTQVVGHHADDWGEDADTVREWFGTIPQSMESLYIIMTLAEWDTMAKTLAKGMSPGIVWPVMIFYILVVAYSMVALITGVICESLMYARNEEESLKLAELEESRKETFKGFKTVCNMIDLDGSGEITREEIQHMLEENPQILTKLDALDVSLEQEDFMTLFEKLSRGAPLPIDKFVEALSSLTGDAKAAALFDLKTDVAESIRLAGARSAAAKANRDQIKVEVLEMHKHMTALGKQMDELLGALCEAGLIDAKRAGLGNLPPSSMKLLLGA
eukprot:gnl/TRDRNA2_/TRDRNA2_61691_c0_seq1.p1 gnl/TRDRNA2_/TRDRNA2_61691_c0~~gnl/TRDRNA2_/TRDRNA2_61691_c0_seq1.p1  ORF type:complete len:519 (+),score=100.00 gnl/TRDRNA2_/TRDRNA2_61691_c0_seq1:110-1666(+)